MDFTALRLRGGLRSTAKNLSITENLFRNDLHFPRRLVLAYAPRGELDARACTPKSARAFGPSLPSKRRALLS